MQLLIDIDVDIIIYIIISRYNNIQNYYIDAYDIYIIYIGVRSGVAVRSEGWEAGRSEFDSRARRLLKARHDVKFIRITYHNCK
jgi:hypothetical protein